MGIKYFNKPPLGDIEKYLDSGVLTKQNVRTIIMIVDI